MNIVLIGSGNVATHMAKAFVAAGATITQIMSRETAHAQELAHAVACASYVDKVEQLDRTADLYILSVTDGALSEVVRAAVGVNPQAVWVHTAGSVGMEVLRPLGNRIGVFYPLQTFSKKNSALAFSEVPLFLEGASEEVRGVLAEMAALLGCSYQWLDSEGRKRMHIAAVVACNFTNHLYALSAELLAKDGVAFDILLPLVEETVAKLALLSPREAQTGPAARGDVGVVKDHLLSLEDGELRRIYALLSDGIMAKYGAKPSEQGQIGYDLTKIRAMLFDVDGVLSCDYLSMGDEGLPRRTANIKDGYALQLAVRKGFHVGIITGGAMEAVRRRYVDLGLRHIYMGASHKVASLEDFYRKTGLRAEEVLYVGDDIPDLPLAPLVGLFCAPADASHEVREVAQYVSPCEGGRGVARDVIRQVLKAHSLWLDEDAYCW